MCFLYSTVCSQALFIEWHDNVFSHYGDLCMWQKRPIHMSIQQASIAT